MSLISQIILHLKKESTIGSYKSIFTSKCNLATLNEILDDLM